MKPSATSPLHAVMEAVPYLLPGKAAQRHHPSDEGVPRNIFLGVGVGLDP
jgi:hypothetical protein